MHNCVIWKKKNSEAGFLFPDICPQSVQTDFCSDPTFPNAIFLPAFFPLAQSPALGALPWSRAHPMGAKQGNLWIRETGKVSALLSVWIPSSDFQNLPLLLIWRWSWPLHQVTLSLLPKTRPFFWTIKMLLVHMSKCFTKLIYEYFSSKKVLFCFSLTVGS